MYSTGLNERLLISELKFEMSLPSFRLAFFSQSSNSCGISDSSSKIFNNSSSSQIFNNSSSSQIFNNSSLIYSKEKEDDPFIMPEDLFSLSHFNLVTGKILLEVKTLRHSSNHLPILFEIANLTYFFLPA